MSLIFLPLQRRYITLTIMVAGTGICLALTALWWGFLVPAAVFCALAALGIHDLTQKRHSILRNYPISAHIRFLLEEIRPEIRQYFLEDETQGMPFPAKNARWSISAPRDSWTRCPLAHSSMSMARDTNG